MSNKSKKNRNATPPPHYELTINTGADRVRITFTGFTEARSVLQAMFNLSSPQAVNDTAVRFAQEGDVTGIQFIQELAEQYGVASGLTPGAAS